MHVARIVTNETCNHNCAFCDARRHVERAAIARGEAVLARIEDAAARGAREIVLTGGEPTLRRDLPLLVARAGRAGAEVVTLETNAALLTDARAEALAKAGLTKARVHIPAWGEAADAITRDAGGFARAVAGVFALARAGVAVEASAPVVRSNLARIPELPLRIAAELPMVRALVLGVPVASPDPSELVSLREAAAAIDAAQERGRSVGLPVRLDIASIIPPCAFESPARVAHLYALTRGGAERPGYARLPACEPCVVRDRCPGPPESAA